MSLEDMKTSKLIIKASLKLPNTNMQSTQLAMLAAILDVLEEIKEEIIEGARGTKRYPTLGLD